MSIKMKALKSFKYAGKRLQAGDEFSARGRSDARILAAIGNAEYQTAVIDTSPQSYSAPVVKAAPQAVDALENMDIEALRELAAKRGVKVHYLAGAKKIREALRAAK
jgi:hypothetical protein